MSFKPDAAKKTVLTDLSARWMPIVDAVLPLLTAIVEPDSFFKKLSAEDNFIDTVKSKMDAMLVAAGQPSKCTGFAELVATT